MDPRSKKTTLSQMGRSFSNPIFIIFYLLQDYRYILVGGIPTPLKNDGVRQMGVLFPIYGKNVPNHHYLYIYIYVIDNPWRSNPGTLHQIRIVRAQQSIRQLPQRRRLWQRFALEDVQDNAAEAIAVPQQGGLGRAPGRRAGNVGDPEILQDGAPVNEFA